MPFFTAFCFYLRIPGIAKRRMAKTVVFAAAFCLSGLTATANAADDTFSCLNELDGLIYENGMLNQIQDSATYFNNDWFNIPDGARFDSRGVVFLGQTNPALPDGSVVAYPVDLRSDLQNTYCWAGAVIRFTNDESQTWAENYLYNSAAIISIAGHAIFDGVRIHNAHDGIRPRRNFGGYWEVRNSWISYNRDDCVENDGFAAGLVDDSLFDGCYVFLSSRIKGSPSINPRNVVTVQNSLIRMQDMPGPFGHNDPSIMGFGQVFKYQAESPDLVLRNNIFLIEDYASTKWDADGSPESSYDRLGFKVSQGRLKECSGNIIVWTGPGDFPGDIPDDPSCVTVTKDRTVWENARNRWLAGHPLVARVEGVDGTEPEPVPEPIPEPEPAPDPEPEPVPEPEPDPAPEPEPAPETQTDITTQDSEPPTVRFVSPFDGATVFPSTSQWIEVEAFDNAGVTRLEVYIDRNGPRIFEGDGPHGFVWTVPDKSKRRIRITAIAYDKAGNSARDRLVLKTAKLMRNGS